MARDLTRSLYGLFGQSPETKYFGLFLYAGHGMIKDGLQYILLNELDKNKGFYVLNQVEKEIRLLTANYMNCYLVAIFACCR